MTILKSKIIKTIKIVALLTLITNFNFGLWLNNTIKIAAAPSLGSTSLGGLNSLSVDKKYVRGGAEFENIQALPSSTVTVRLKYDNTGNQSATDAQIVDSLPAGFTYVSGSFKNCLTPSVAELVCDTMNPMIVNDKNNSFAALIGQGVSPSVGLYDKSSAANLGGTIPAANSGNLEIGKKRYINNHRCKFSPPSYTNHKLIESKFGSFGNYSNMVSNNPIFPVPHNNIMLPPVSTQANGDCIAAYPFFTTGSKVSIDTLGTRYVNVHNCKFNQTYNGSEESQMFGDFGTESNRSTNTPTYSVGTYTDAQSDCQTNYPSNQTSAFGKKTSLDTLGKRYINMHSCFSINNYSVVTESQMFGDLGTFSNMTSNSNSFGSDKYSYAGPECVAAYSATGAIANGGNKISLDLLDSNRAKGYIEYTVNTPSLVGQYGTGVTIRDSGFFVGSNDITANAEDPFVNGVNNTIDVQNNLITATQIISYSCSPDFGTVGYTTTCTANITAGKVGNIVFYSTLGNCITPAIIATDIIASCSFSPVSGISEPVTAIASGNGSVTSGTISATKIIDNADINTYCSPLSGPSGFVSNCTTNFTAGKTGNITISAGAAGNCVINSVLTSDTTRNCNITTNGNGSYPIQISANGSAASNTGASLNIERIDMSIHKLSDTGSDSQTNTQGNVMFSSDTHLDYTINIKNNSLNFFTLGALTFRDKLNDPLVYRYFPDQVGWQCNYEYHPITNVFSEKEIICINIIPVPPNVQSAIKIPTRIT